RRATPRGPDQSERSRSASPSLRPKTPAARKRLTKPDAIPSRSPTSKSHGAVPSHRSRTYPPHKPRTVEITSVSPTPLRVPTCRIQRRSDEPDPALLTPVLPRGWMGTLVNTSTACRGGQPDRPGRDRAHLAVRRMRALDGPRNVGVRETRRFPMTPFS